MDSIVHGNQSATYNNSRDCGNVKNCNNNNFANYNIDNSYTSFDNCNVSISDETRRVLEWLSPLTSRDRHQTVRNARADGVGDWLLDTEVFSAWSTLDDQGARPVLLCYGDPGVGKTFISSLVIDTLGNKVGGAGVAITYVYCDFGSRNVQSATTILASVLRQVVATLRWIPTEVQKAFEKAKSQSDGCGPRLPDICEMLIKSLLGLRRGVICIDALDEFPEKYRPELWKSLRDIVEKSPNARLFVTGRPHIRDEVRRYFPTTAELLPISPPERDIELYLQKRLSGDPSFDAMDEGLRADILKIIPEKISRIFLLVRINIDAILEEPTIHRRRQALQMMTSSPGLQEAYNRTMDRIRKQSGSKSRLGMEALMWTSHCERPLKSEELCHALGVELGKEDISIHNVPTIRTVMACTLGLISIDKEGSTVRLLHHTFQEYLGERPTLFVSARSMMAEICLTYLTSPTVGALPPNPEKNLVTTPFLEYATCLWGTHAALEVTERVESLSLRLLDGYEHHPSAMVLWRKKIRNRYYDKEDVQGISGLHCVAFWGIPEIASAMLEMKRWDVNGQDSEGKTPLMWAARHGNVRVAELFLEQGVIEPNQATRDGSTAFLIAVQWSNESVVKLFLKHAAVNPDTPDVDGRTPLSHAVVPEWEEDPGMVKLLLERADVNPDSLDASGRTPLSCAVGHGFADTAKLLLGHVDVDPNSVDKEGLTPLLHAVSNPEWAPRDVVKLLLGHRDINPDLSDNDGRTPLSLAAEYGHGDIVRQLLEHGGVNPNSVDKEGITPLLHALSDPEWEPKYIVKLLLGHPDINPDLSNNDGRTPLSLAAGYGCKDAVRQLLGHGDVNPNSVDKGGLTPLLHVIRNWDLEQERENLVELLLDHADINPNLSDTDGRTPLSLVVDYGHKDVVKQLLEHRGVNPDSLDVNGRTPISYAAERGAECIVKLLLDRRDVKPDSSDTHGRTPLSYAAGRGERGVMELLLGYKDVNPDSLDCNGRTPLSIAALRGHRDVVKLLLERGGVNPNSADKDGRTPLSFAAGGAKQSIVKLLLERGDINPDLWDNNGRTPLSLAACAGSEGVVNLLLRRQDVYPNSWDYDGRTPLSFAVSSGHESIVEILLQHELVDSNWSDSDGRTPLSYAEQRGSRNLIKLLSEAGNRHRQSMRNM